MDINKDNLEKALSSDKSQKNDVPKMSKEMEVGFHQGALNTLASERMELIKVIQNVEKIMEIHLNRLEELGIKLEKRK